MRLSWLSVTGAGVLVAASGSAHAVQYYSAEQVQKALFPAAAEFRAKPFLLTEAQRDAIAKKAGARVREVQVRLWEARDAQGALLGYLMIDEVTGKHEYITYALALSAQGQVAGLEIMDYRESYGGQIRDPRWRGQFVGKGSGDALQVDKDIKNISGATLSSVHVTDGIRRLLATFELAVKTGG